MSGLYLYDLHIHSCLSPCANDDMTPNNIVNMANLCGLDVIALTDHNSTKNTAAAVKAGKKAGLLVIPGMELTTSEEIHVICLFPDIKKAEKFGEMVLKKLPKMQNDENIFGTQILMNENDNVIGKEEILLASSSSISIDDVVSVVSEFGGGCFPAHIDRQYTSVISNLGVFPVDCGFCAAEVTEFGVLEDLYQLGLPKKMPVLGDSDAHMLEKIGIREKKMKLPSLSAKAVIDFITAKY